MRKSKRRHNIIHHPNRPTPSGIEAGKHLSRLYERMREDAAQRAPEALACLEDPCSSCAFRAGTVPNGCPDTVLDALKCALEGRRFLCHMSPRDEAGHFTKVCSGWLVTQRADRAPVQAPWPWTEDGMRRREARRGR